MFSTTLRRLAQQKPLNDVYSSPYKAKRLWPPDFSKLSPKHQFRLERRYKRRAKLKWARPRWTKAVKIVQMSSILFVAVYGVLFLDWNQPTEKQPFQDIRKWFFGMTGSMWTQQRYARREENDDASPTAKS
ncbi:hypothetical protein BP5796_06580 [Coleophoma crateriformis]|uniref:Uncharacterized protein n=1 Tax=Coleophoma crateriformis TaxID=565419 RepID=A0A3D8RNY4_9HELO|nr:hypothetical protein BP5796_06580 [Coleophoma crateriformis]